VRLVSQAEADAAISDLADEFIIEALSWAETTDHGRLGYERAHALFAARLATEREAGARDALAEVERRIDLNATWGDGLRLAARIVRNYRSERGL
jgi:hypothetical protein